LVNGKHTPNIAEFTSYVEQQIPALQPFFDRLRDVDPDFENITLKFDDDLASMKGANGMYDGYTDTISLNRYFTHKTFVHELVHGVTSRRLRKAVLDQGAGPTFVAKGENYLLGLEIAASGMKGEPLGKMMDYYVRAVRAFEKQTGVDFSAVVNTEPGRFFDYSFETPHYGLFNVDEFMAEAISNPTFQKFLNNIPSDNPNKTLWAAFIDIMRDIFDVKKGGNGATLLDDVLTEFAQIPLTGKRLPELNIKQMKNLDFDIPRVKDAASQLTPGTMLSATNCILQHAT
jgi:hypothetical protein